MNGHSGLARLPILIEAALALIRGRAFVKFAMFSRAISSSSVKLKPRRFDSPEEIVCQVMKAIESVAARIPLRTLCFERGLAAQLMLRRRGMEAILHFGATVQKGNLSAHVWVSVGDRTVIGGNVIPMFAELKKSPEVPSVESDA